MKFPTGGTARELNKQIRLNSEANSKVWMKEDIYDFFIVFIIRVYNILSYILSSEIVFISELF